MDFLVNGVASFLTAASKLLPTWTFLHNVADDVNTLAPYFQKANVLFPMDTVFTLLSLWLGLQLLLIALYWLDRVINLLRGAG